MTTFQFEESLLDILKEKDIVKEIDIEINCDKYMCNITLIVGFNTALADITYEIVWIESDRIEIQFDKEKFDYYKISKYEFILKKN